MMKNELERLQYLSKMWKNFKDIKCWMGHNKKNFSDTQFGSQYTARRLEVQSYNLPRLHWTGER